MAKADADALLRDRYVIGRQILAGTEPEYLIGQGFDSRLVREMARRLSANELWPVDRLRMVVRSHATATVLECLADGKPVPDWVPKKTAHLAKELFRTRCQQLGLDPADPTGQKRRGAASASGAPFDATALREWMTGLVERLQDTATPEGQLVQVVGEAIGDVLGSISLNTCVLNVQFERGKPLEWDCRVHASMALPSPGTTPEAGDKAVPRA